jgi:hypothetical protein
MRKGEFQMNRVFTWLLAGTFAAGAGCAATTPARASSSSGAAEQEQTPAPEAQPAQPGSPESAAAAEIRAAQRAAARAERDAAAAERDAQRALETTHKRMAEVQARLARARDGQNAYAFRVNGEVKKEKVAYLGVTTSQVPPALRQHLKLPRGFGLVVDTIEKDSAAAAAGVERYDILQKLNDQLLVNSQQLGVLVRSMKPGDDVRLTVLRNGETKEVTAKLQEKEVPAISDAGGMFEWSGEFPAVSVATPVAPVPPIQAFQVEPNGQFNTLKLFTDDDEQSTSVYQDRELTLTITQDEEGKSLEAKDNDGQKLFEGPINNDEERRKLPKNVADKLAKFESKLEKMPLVKGKGVNIRVVEPEE